MKATWKILLFIWMTGFIFSGCKESDVVAPNVELPNKDYSLHGGATFSNDGHTATFRLYAPGKQSIYVIGDFNDWEKKPDYKMTEDDNGFWTLTVDGLNPTKRYGYQYFIDNTIRVADPYSHLVLDPDNDSYISSNVFPNIKRYPHWKTMGYISVIQAKKKRYQWQVKDFTSPKGDDLVIYELLIRDFTAGGSFKGAISRLDYLKKLGINAIEVLPVNEFEGNNSWGYNPSFMLALDKSYGAPYDYKHFVDECHKRGIAVIQDIVLHDQFGSSPLIKMWANSSGTPSSDNPYFYLHNRHPFAVGYQMDQTTEATKRYVKDVIKYWLEEYHIDGYRMDQGKAFTSEVSNDNQNWSDYNQERVDFWKSTYDYIKGIDPKAYVILEYFTQARERDAVIDHGLYVWNELHYSAKQAAMGYIDESDLSGLFYHNLNAKGGMVSFFESHDKERIQYEAKENGKSSGDYNTKKLATRLERAEMLGMFLFVTPGPRMIWEFQERGYDISIEKDGKLAPKDPHWEEMQNLHRKELYETYAKFVHIRLNNDIFTSDNTHYTSDLGGAIKWVNLSNDGKATVQAIGNFDVVSHDVNIIFNATGTWYDNFSDKTFEVSDPNKVYTLKFKPGEYHLYSRGSKLK